MESAKKQFIKTFVRIRPEITRERNDNIVVHTEGDHTIKLTPLPEELIEDDEDYYREFRLDRVYNDSWSNIKIWEDFGQEIVDQLFKGINYSLIMYGQSRSGKSHTLLGNDCGLISLFGKSLFQRLENSNMKYNVEMSIVELYNEEIKDRLSQSNDSLAIRESKERGIHVEHLSQHQVNSEQEIQTLVKTALKQSAISDTQMGRATWRACKMYSLNISQEDNLLAKINFVELPGSERLKESNERSKEGFKHIKSLHTLEKIFHALDCRRSAKINHIPYRDSKLTRLLQDSLTSYRLIMMFHISPMDSAIIDTFLTLKQANIVKYGTTKPKPNNF